MASRERIDQHGSQQSRHVRRLNCYINFKWTPNENENENFTPVKSKSRK